MKTVLRYLGRVVALRPAVYGELFERHCTVTRRTQARVFEEDPETGDTHMKVEKKVDDLEMFWYDKIGDTDVFCTYSGYGRRIEATLKKRGIEFSIENFVDDGLGAPDIKFLSSIKWRGRQGEIVAKILANKGGVIDCPTAYGKTFIIGKIARAYPKAKIVITVPYADVAKKIYSDLESELRGQLGSLWTGRNKPGRVTVAVSKSLHKCDKDTNLILVDESHALLTDAYISKLNRFHRARIFGFSATVSGRSDKADGLAEAIYGPVLARVGYQEAVKTNNVVQLQVRMYHVAEGPALDWCENKTYVDRHGLWLHSYRNNLIAKVVREIEQEVGDEQILVMVDTFEHAYALGNLLPEYAIITGTPSPARVKRLRRAKIMTKDQKICTPKDREEYRVAFEERRLMKAISNKVWRQGVDFRDLRVLIRADGSASAIDAGQIPGRLSRLGDKTLKSGGILIDFVDEFTGQLMGRSMARLRSYNKNGWSIKHYGKAG